MASSPPLIQRLHKVAASYDDDRCCQLAAMADRLAEAYLEQARLQTEVAAVRRRVGAASVSFKKIRAAKHASRRYVIALEREALVAIRWFEPLMPPVAKRKRHGKKQRKAKAYVMPKPIGRMPKIMRPHVPRPRARQRRPVRPGRVARSKNDDEPAHERIRRTAYGRFFC